MRLLVVLLAALAAAPAMAGCLDGLRSPFTHRPDYPVSRTAIVTGAGAWNLEPTFTVQVEQALPVLVEIEARPVPSGAALSASGQSNATTAVSLTIPDGTWTVSYKVGGIVWETFKEARFDSTPPRVDGLETVGSAPSGSYLLGANAHVEAGATVEVVEQATGGVYGMVLPLQLSGLTDGVHAFDVVARDEAGNQAVASVQVLAGSATSLPKGLYTMGIVARYTTTAKLWDITDLNAFVSPADARARAPDYLGSGTGIEPDDASVTQVIDAVVQPGMTSAEVALALYTWMFDHLDYDETRLDDTNLLTPAQTLQAHGGVCRDLAALYVSLLRASGVPARLVAGYLSGRVGGFHAWVEFYGGEGRGPSPWVPVDVSGIDGPYTVAGMLQTFGVRLPEHLMLRALTPQQEQGDWSSAATLTYSGPEPQAPFQKKVIDVSVPVRQVLCMNQATHARKLSSSKNQCTSSYVEDFVTQAVRVLDYGVRVDSAARGSDVTLALVYPDVPGNNADRVEFVYYYPDSTSGLHASAFKEDAQTGRATGELRR